MQFVGHVPEGLAQLLLIVVSHLCEQLHDPWIRPPRTEN
jgi:hypothetical protein